MFCIPLKGHGLCFYLFRLRGFPEPNQINKRGIGTCSFFILKHNYMKNVKFLPWVGGHYLQGIFGSRVMILGESHYCASVDDAVSNLTIDVIRDLFDVDSEHEGYKNTYIKFERALAGKSLSFPEKESVWNSILFYNYVQVPISGVRIAPTSLEFTLSEIAFLRC